MTYDELVARMGAAYAAEAGFYPDDTSDAGIRIRVLAGEVMNTLHRLEGIAADAFPQTAQGEALDNHAGQRGLTRRGATPSVGTLRFSRETPLTYDVEIPAGTVCASSGAAVEFETTETVILKEGEVSVTAAARSVGVGREMNAAIGAVDTLVTPPNGIERVENATPFSGGTNAEDDESLRARLMACYAILPNGVNAETYRRTALTVPGVMSAGVVPRVNGTGTVGVYVYGDGGPVSEEVLAQVKDCIDEMREISVTVTVENARPIQRRVTMYLTPKAGCTFEEADALVRQALERYFANLTVGKNFTTAAVYTTVMETGVVENCNIPSSVSDYITPPNEIVTLMDIVTMRSSVNNV